MCNKEVNETLDHLTYDPTREIAISKYKGILGEIKFRVVINLDENGLGFLPGIGNETPDLVAEISKSFLCQIRAIRDTSGQ